MKSLKSFDLFESRLFYKDGIIFPALASLFYFFTFSYPILNKLGGYAQGCREGLASNIAWTGSEPMQADCLMYSWESNLLNLVLFLSVVITIFYFMKMYNLGLVFFVLIIALIPFIDATLLLIGILSFLGGNFSINIGYITYILAIVFSIITMLMIFEIRKEMKYSNQ